LTHRVDIWIAEPPQIAGARLLSAYDRLLSGSERTRQRSLLLEKNRHEQLVARALVRTTLSEYAATRPADWQFSVNAHGRPAIEPASSLRFNLSHHPSMVVCAVAFDVEVGVDVEPQGRAGEILSVADRVFAPRELAELRALPDAMARDRALSLWTLKEAYIKARGLGLSLPLAEFAFTFDARDPRITFETGLADRPERWLFRTYEVNGHRVALALENERSAREPEIRLRFTVPLSGATVVG
jgi:4'-phosphopantetheinyl transferase